MQRTLPIETRSGPARVHHVRDLRNSLPDCRCEPHVAGDFCKAGWLKPKSPWSGIVPARLASTKQHSLKRYRSLCVSSSDWLPTLYLASNTQRPNRRLCSRACATSGTIMSCLPANMFPESLIMTRCKMKRRRVTLPGCSGVSSAIVVIRGDAVCKLTNCNAHSRMPIAIWLKRLIWAMHCYQACSG